MSAPNDAVQVDRRFFDALLDGDGEALTMILDPQFLIVDVAVGDMTTRQDFISAVESGAVGFVRIDTFPDESRVRSLGECVVIIGRTRMELKLPDHSTQTVGSRYTHIFTQGGTGGWRLASAQGTALPDSQRAP